MDCISILHITDSHILASNDARLLGVDTAYYFNAVLDHIIQTKEHFDLCLATGDLAQDPNSASYLKILKGLNRLNMPCFCLPGNHDELAFMQTILQSDLISCQKHLMMGGWQIICLNTPIPNSPNGRLEKSELAFLETCLQQNPDLFTLIAVHHHAAQCGSLWMDKMIIENAEDLFAITRRFSNVKALINGHIHQTMDVVMEGIRLLSTPSTCFQFKPHCEVFTLDTLSPGYRSIKLGNDGQIKTKVLRIPEKLTSLQVVSQGY